MVDAVDAQDGLRELKDFPAYDTSFQDGPKFRQNLSHWALKTEKLANVLTNLADSFQQFHDSGVEHYNAAICMLSNIQEIGLLCNSNHANTVSTPLQKFSENLTNLWCYYEAFLGQTKMLNIGPVRELATSFVNLKKLYDELLHYREEYRSSAETLCACRHMTRLPDKVTFTTLTESCYSAEKTYRLILSKYLTLLRQAHTKDIMMFLRRIIEHILSLFAYHNNSAIVLREIESEVNDFFCKSKDWKTFYEEELSLWSKLHHGVQRHIMAEFQHNVGLIPPLTPGGDGPSGSAYLAKLKKFPSHVIPKRDSKPAFSAALQNLVSEKPCRMTSDGKRSSHLESTSSEHCLNRPHHLPMVRTHSSPHVDFEKPRVSTGGRSRAAVQSVSDPDLITTDNLGLLDDPFEVAEGFEILYMPDTPLTPSEPNILSTDSDDVQSDIQDSFQNSKGALRHSQDTDTLESAANECEHILLRSQTNTVGTNTSSFRPLAAVIQRAKLKKEKKKQAGTNSSENNTCEANVEMSTNHTQEEGDSLSGSPPECQSPVSTRKAGKTSVSSLFKKKNRKVSKLKSSPSQPDKLSQESLSKEPSISPPAQLSPGGLNNVASENKGSPVLLNGSVDSPGRLPKRDPSHKVSRPAIPEKRESDSVNYNLQKLVLALPSSWVKCGYLWLRMKLPNNRYAWTYIYCVVDKDRGELMIQEQSLPRPRKLENLMLCNTRSCNPDFIDRNYCFRVISPSSEHLFQTLSEQEMISWVNALQETTEEALKRADHRVPQAVLTQSSCNTDSVTFLEIVTNAMKEILAVPGNKICADCSSTTGVEWASINLGIVICIKCSGIHRGLGVHVSKVRSLNLDKWDRSLVDFMLSQGNNKSNGYYEATLGDGLFVDDVKRPTSKSRKEERNLFIQQKYVALAFVPECGDDRSTHL